jgi:hypothetical protein
MKSYPTRTSILIILVVLAMQFATAQISETSKSFELVTSKKNQPGAAYRINSIKANVDALITVEKLSSSATLDSIYFSGLGFSAAFQPELSIAPGRWGYIQFDIQFVQAGTVIPVAVKDIPVAGKKYGRIKYAGSNSFGKDVELAIIRSSATSFKVRMYATNPGGTTSSVKSNVFFEQYAYANPSLIANPVVQFTASAKDSSVKLNWKLESPNTIAAVILERSYNGAKFDDLNEYEVSAANGKATDFNYSDRVAQTFVCYRLEIVSETGNIAFSNTLKLKMDDENYKSISLNNFTDLQNSTKSATVKTR